MLHTLQANAPVCARKNKLLVGVGLLSCAHVPPVACVACVASYK